MIFKYSCKDLQFQILVSQVIAGSSERPKDPRSFMGIVIVIAMAVAVAMVLPMAVLTAMVVVIAIRFVFRLELKLRYAHYSQLRLQLCLRPIWLLQQLWLALQ